MRNKTTYENMAMQSGQPSVTIPVHNTVNVVPKLCLTLSEACEALSVSRTRLFRMIAEGSIASIGTYKQRRITTAECLRWIAAQEAASGNGNAAA